MSQIRPFDCGPVTTSDARVRRDPEAIYFYVQAASEAGVIAATDRNAGPDAKPHICRGRPGVPVCAKASQS